MFTRKAIKGWLAVAVFGLLCAVSLQAQQPVSAQGSGVQNTSDAAWTTSTGSNTAVTLISNTAIYNSILVTLIQGTTISAGAATFEMSTDNSAWIGVQGVAVGTTALMGPTYTLVASTNAAFLFPVNAPYFRVRLSTTITGSGTVTIEHASQTLPAVGLLAGAESLAAGSNVIGHVIADSGSTTAVTGNVTVAQGTGSNLHAELDSGSTTAVTQATGSNLHAELDSGSTTAATQSTGANLETAPVTTATTTDTASRCTLVSAASTNATNCKSSSGNVYGFRFVNTTATVYYLRMYNTSSSPTCSSATGFIESIPIPASATGAGIVAIEPFGEGYSTGISFCFTGGSSSTDNTNAATGVFGTVLYK